MTPAKIFGIIIRVFGLSLLVYSIWYLTYGIATILGLPEQQEGYKIGYFLSGTLFLLLALYLLRGAPHIIKFSYPNEN